MKPHEITPADAAKLFGGPGPEPEHPDLHLVDDEDYHAEPELVTQKRGQLDRAVERMKVPTDGLPTLRFPDLEKITGPMLPGQLWVVLARPENGKTTFCMNVGLKWVMTPPRIGFAYFGTEEGAESQQLRFASLLSGNPAAEVLAGEWHKIGGEDAEREIQSALLDINLGEYAELVFFCEETRPRLGDVKRAAEDAVKLGLPVLVLDHFHRMAVPESHNQVATLAETVRQVKQLAVETGLVILMAAQAKRAAEGSLARFLPPLAESGMGTSALEQEADVMLGLFRPIGMWDEEKRDYRPLTRGELSAFERGELEQGNVLIPNTMGVKVLKHRRNADYSGRIVKLHCERGLLASHTGRVR
jgi:replicative DNA helicase